VVKRRIAPYGAIPAFYNNNIKELFMKSAIRFLGIIAIAAVIGFSMTACGDGAAGRPATLEDFQGKWVNLYAINSVRYSDFSFTFTGNQMLFRSIDSNGGLISRPGTFTFTNTHITFIAPPNTWQGYTQAYTLSGNQLTLESDGKNPNGVFTRQ
jgi:hypothetical protein